MRLSAHPATLAAAPGTASAAAASPPARFVNFYDEQTRRRRQTWRLSLLCLLLALALGVAMSAILGPLLLAVAAGALKLAAALGCTEVCGQGARAIGLFAREELRSLTAIADHGSKAATFDARLAVARELVVFARVLAPALVAAALAWILIRRSLARAGMQELVTATQARPPRRHEPKERQLINAADEMAIAAGLATPRVMVIESEVANAVVAGNSPASATLLVTRGLLDRLEGDQIKAVAAHCVAAIGNGDQRIMQSLLATFLTLGLFHTILDLPFRTSAWRALRRFVRVTFDRQASPAQVDVAARGIEDSFAPESLDHKSVYMVPLLPFRLVTLFQRFVLMMWCILVVSWPLALMWRGRRYLADSTAIELGRDPDALAAALARIAPHAGIPPGAERRDYLFMWGVGRGRGALDRYGITLPLHPRIERRLKRVFAMGAISGAASSEHPAVAAASRRRRILGFVIYFLIVSPFLLLGACAALALVGAILWISLFTVLISLILGLGFLALVFGS